MGELKEYYEMLQKWAKHNFKNQEQREDFIQYVMMKVIERPKRQNKNLIYFKTDWLRVEFGRIYTGNGKRKRRIRKDDVLQIAEKPGEQATEEIIDAMMFSDSEHFLDIEKQDDAVDHQKITNEMLEALTTRERVIVKMRFFSDYTLGEIAERLNVTESLICGILKKAFIKLKWRFPENRKHVR